MTDQDYTDPAAAAKYATEAANQISEIYSYRVSPAMKMLKALREPSADDNEAVWALHFGMKDTIENIVIDGIHEASQLQLDIVAATLPHVIADYYNHLVTSRAPHLMTSGVAGHWLEKSSTYGAIETLAQVGFSWGNGFAERI